MENFIVTLLLGWAGVHKFLKGKIGMGLLYLFTFGVFGIGWFIDIIIAISSLTSQSTTTPSVPQNNTSDTVKISYHKMFNVAGVTYNCSLDKDMKRQEVLDYCKKRDKLHLKYHEYKGSPAFLVVLDKNNLDIGSVPANLVQTILKYKERNTKIEFVEISSFNPSDSKKEINYAKVRFIVYKD